MNTYIGLHIKEAEQLALKLGWKETRITKENGEYFVIILNHCEGRRINFEIENNIITHVWVG